MLQTRIPGEASQACRRLFVSSVANGKEGAAGRRHAENAAQRETDIKDSGIRRSAEPEGPGGKDHAPRAHDPPFVEPPHQPGLRQEKDLASRCPAEDLRAQDLAASFTKVSNACSGLPGLLLNSAWYCTAK